MNKRIVLLVIIATVFGLFFALDLGQFLTFDYLKAQQAQLQQLVSGSPVTSVLIYAVIYVVATALSIPGAALLTLLGGALFGVLLGTVVVSFASSLGATLAFLVARFLLHDTVQEKFGERLQTINRNVKQDGAFYLFSLRLVPVFPFFVINLLMGLTPIKTRIFYGISQLGMLPATIVYVNAGTQLASLDSPAGLLSPALLGSFALLALFPWLAKAALALLNKRKVYEG